MILAVALPASAKFRWGPTVGANFSHYHWRQKLVRNDVLAGYSAGVLCEVMIPGIGFGFDFGLKYMDHGGRVHFEDQYIWSSDGIGKTDLRMHVVQLPINLRFKWTRMNGVEDYIAPFVYGGPQFNFNVANTKCEAIKRNGFAVGLGCGIGAEIFKRYQIQAGYVWDVTNDLKTRKLDDFYGQIRGWTIDFTVLF